MNLTDSQIVVLRGIGKCWVGLVIVLALTGAVVAQPLGVTDDQGVMVSFSQPPKRIVSLLPSLTETVCALGQCKRLVAVDRDSNFPPNVQQLPQVGGGLDPNLEAIVALKPDLVLMATSSRAAERLLSLGIKVVSLEPRTHADVKRTLETVGHLLAVPDAARVWREMDAGLSALAQSLPVGVKATRVYFEVNAGPYAAGEASFIGETLTRLGVQNIVPARLGAFPLLNPEFVVRADPDLIMLGDHSDAGMTKRPGWAAMRAIAQQRVCVFTPAESDLLVRPGPRMVEGARVMAQCLLRFKPKGSA